MSIDTKGEFCEICGAFVEGFEYKGCCSGRECGCMGLPIEPCICSDKCYTKATNTNFGHGIIQLTPVDREKEKEIDAYFSTKPVKTKKVMEDYNELLMAVETKYPNETRHETALKYIRQAEGKFLRMKIKCVECNGTGYNGSCFACMGDGCVDNPELLNVTKYIREAERGKLVTKVKCTECKGQGTLWTGDTCYVCKGNGCVNK